MFIRICDGSNASDELPIRKVVGFIDDVAMKSDFHKNSLYFLQIGNNVTNEYCVRIINYVLVADIFNRIKTLPISLGNFHLILI